MAEQTIDNFKLYVDGAARNNPGPAGAGVYIEKNKTRFYSNGFFLGSKTNNQAEYLALIIGLFYVKKNLKEADLLEIISDSELLVRQISGIYKIKNLELKKLHGLAMTMLQKLNYVISHVIREQNIKADKNANHAIDKKISLDQDFINFLKDNEIHLF